MASESKDKTYIPGPFDDLIMLVKTLFQALHPATFEIIRRETDPNQILAFWNHYEDIHVWKHLLKAASGDAKFLQGLTPYEFLKYRISFLLQQKPYSISNITNKEEEEEPKKEEEEDKGEVIENEEEIIEDKEEIIEDEGEIIEDEGEIIEDEVQSLLSGPLQNEIHEILKKRTVGTKGLWSRLFQEVGKVKLLAVFPSVEDLQAAIDQSLKEGELVCNEGMYLLPKQPQ